MRIHPRESYDHPGSLGPALDLSRVTGFDLHHTAGSLDESPYSIANSTRREWGRSSYNFLVSQVHEPGDVFEMQGLHRGAHNDGENSTRIGIVVVGYYHPHVNHSVTDVVINTVAALIAHGHDEWGIPIHVKGHRDTDATACPGTHLHARIGDIAARAKELSNMADFQHPHPDPDKFGHPGFKKHFDRLRREEIFSEHTKPGDIVEAAQLAVYLDALLEEYAALRRRVYNLEADEGEADGLTIEEIRRDIAARIGG